MDAARVTILLAILGIVAASAGCAGALGILPRDCDYSAGFFDERRGWRVQALAPERAPRALASTDAGEFALDLNVTLDEGERRVDGAYGPSIQTGQMRLRFVPDEGGRLRAGVSWCGDAAPTLTCDTADNGPGLSGEGHGFAISRGVADGACSFSVVLNEEAYGRRDVLRWRVEVEEGDTFRVVATSG